MKIKEANLENVQKMEHGQAAIQNAKKSSVQTMLHLQTQLALLAREKCLETSVPLNAMQVMR